MPKNKIFSMLIAGVGGQGLITLTQIVAEAAKIEGKGIRTSELHGLSQRGGSVETHIRFGEKVWSPLVGIGEADFVLSLEISEALKMIQFSNKDTAFLVNKYYIPFENSLSLEETEKKINELVKGQKHLIPASEICKKELNSEVVSGIYLLGYAALNNLIPLKQESIMEAINTIVPEKYLDLNKKAFELAKK
jgi:indolepyruvate ferredoxin oxidoreductase beta subunit